jgi:Class II flagellar assembly regulator
MKIGGTNGVGPTGPARSTNRSAGGDFRLSKAGGNAEAASTAPASGTTSVGSIDALMALQEVGNPLERRRKAVRRASKLLDLLDGVRDGLLDGEVSVQSLNGLMTTIREERSTLDDPHLDGLLNDIETRASVEIAKLEMASRRS